MAHKITLHVEGKIIDVSNKMLISEMPRMRRMPDGSVIFPARGEPPETPAGFKRDPYDAFHFIPDLPCLFQEQQTRKKSCGKLVPVIWCSHRQQLIHEDICMTCPDCPL